MGEDAAQLALVHQVEDAGGHGDRGMVRIATRREGVGLGSVDDVQAGHRQAGAHGEVCDKSRGDRAARPA